MLGSLILVVAPASAARAADCPWVGSSASPDQRADQVIAAMKARDGAASVADEVGLVTGVTGPYTGNIAKNDAFCIPALNLMDGPAGVRSEAGTTTQLPAPVAAAATWNTGTETTYGKVVGAEVAGKGGNVSLGPTVNIVRDPRWGRAFETLGEDGYLSGQMGAAHIDGIQSKKVMAQVKHLAAYNQETDRQAASDNVVIDTRTLHETYLPAFQAAVKAGVASVMCSYNRVTTAPDRAHEGGTTDWACENSYLQNTVFKGQFGSGGFITSDWGAVHSTAKAAKNGLDMDMPGYDDNEPWFGPKLIDAVNKEPVLRSSLDDMAHRVLREMFAFGLFGKAPSGSVDATVTTSQNVATARAVSEEGTVLLKNNKVLPFAPSSVRSIAVIGDDAGSKALTSGGGSANVPAASGQVVTPYQGIKARAAKSGVTVGTTGSDPVQAVALAKNSDVAVVFASKDEAEAGDLSDIDLSGSDNSLIEQVAATGKPTVVVLNTGSAVTMPWLDKVAGVFEAWYPGQEDGNAIASLLFGDVNPSAKLPVTFPKSLADAPAATPDQWTGTNNQVQYSEGNQVGYRWYDTQGKTPLFAFGYGLSYTTFAFTGLHVTGPDSGGTVTVSATVTNTGTRPGAEVAQLYLGSPATTGEPPHRLRGFVKTSTLGPQDSQTVTFHLSSADMATWSTATSNWTTPGGTYHVSVGDSYRNLPLNGTFTINGPDPAGETVAGVAANLCLDDRAASTADKTPIQIYPCNNTIAQKVTAESDGTLRIQGKCVDVKEGGLTNETPVWLYRCNGTGAQTWQPQPDGALRNPQSKRCLDDPAATLTAGTQLQIYDCNGTAAQRWRIP